jgi:hypothetical protein
VIPRRSKLGGVVAGLFALAVLTAVVVFAGLGSAANSSGNAAAHEYQYGHKVAICHRTHSFKHRFVTISVSQRAVRAHLAHGDLLGPCPAPPAQTRKHHDDRENGDRDDGDHEHGGPGKHGHGHKNATPSTTTTSTTRMTTTSTTNSATTQSSTTPSHGRGHSDDAHGHDQGQGNGHG